MRSIIRLNKRIITGKGINETDFINTMFLRSSFFWKLVGDKLFY
ncbi:plectrovirus-related protein (plasmid) [Spiroplasma citri]|nr:plectrovirus-related protein [Spiroplasma citri]